MSAPADAALAPAQTVVYVANADSHDIAVLALDASDAGGTLREIDRFAAGGAVMPLAVRPDKRVLYASIRSDPFRVLSLAIDPASGMTVPPVAKRSIWRKAPPSVSLPPSSARIAMSWLSALAT